MPKHPADQGILAPPGSKRTKTSRKTLTVNDYTIGWICALSIEMAAAESMLDEVHEMQPRRPNDDNAYTYGSIQRHNIVIACLPQGGYGTNNAANVGTHMRRSFPRIIMFLLVGIGGGVPGKDDIRLGDVVVGTSVVQHDLGKVLQQGRFQSTALVREPSPSLMNAVSKLRSRHEAGPSMIRFILDHMRERNPTMTPYAECESFQDLLFNDTYSHDQSAATCADCDRSQVVARPQRTFSGPMIHYGTIASGNVVVKDAATRDRLAQEHNAICFEMEAAGLMSALECLVVRGVSDYSDSHKNKEWQKYAAGTAAAYASELLSVIPPEALPVLSEEEIVRKRAEHRQHSMESLSFERMEARQSNITRAFHETCKWLLSHPDYIKWTDPTNFPHHRGFLWIRGKPGAGKSTVMKFILKDTGAGDNTTISFFFNARGADLEKATDGMYRSLLVQLLRKLPELQEVLDIDDTLDCASKCKKKDWEIEELQDLFRAAVSKLGQRRVVCFIDALDECDESQIREMIEYFEDLGTTALNTEGNLYICFSSRHYPAIQIRNGQTLTLEDQLGHSQDLEKYVRSKLRAGEGQDAEKVRTDILKKAAGVFMWVVLVVKMLNKEYQQGRIFAVKQRLERIPAELSQLFKDILGRDNENVDEFRLSIQWILYAKRPLQAHEYYYALAAGLDGTSDSLVEWDPELVTADAMGRYVSNSSKGLAEVTKSGDEQIGTVQFIHESVRDFLLKDGGIDELWPDCGADIESLSHDQLKQCCHTYLRTIELSSYVTSEQKLSEDDLEREIIRSSKVLECTDFPFLEYATHQVLYHANIAAIKVSQDEFMSSFSHQRWIITDILVAGLWQRHRLSASLSDILAENGCANLLPYGILAWHNATDSKKLYDRALLAALAHGHRDAAKFLLRLRDNSLGLDYDSALQKLSRGWGTVSIGHSEDTPLTWATDHDLLELVWILVKQGAHMEPMVSDNDRQEVLSFAVSRGHAELVRMLLESGVNIESTVIYGRTPLLYAVENGQVDISRLLLERGADIESKDQLGRTPLTIAVHDRKIDMVRLLLEKGANVELRDKDGRAPLTIAVHDRKVDMVRLLLEKGANTESKDHYDRTPLIHAVSRRHADLVHLLLEKGANIESRDKKGQTPLLHAVFTASTDLVCLLLEKGASIESRDEDGRTALVHAVSRLCANSFIARLLLEKGAKTELKDQYGRTPLIHAVLGRHADLVHLLLEKGANTESRDKTGRTPLMHAVSRDYADLLVARLLLEKGADIESKDQYGWTPLIHAVFTTSTDLVRLLLEKGANIESRDNDGRTSREFAERWFLPDIVQLLDNVETIKKSPSEGTNKSGEDYKAMVLECLDFEVDLV